VRVLVVLLALLALSWPSACGYRIAGRPVATADGPGGTAARAPTLAIETLHNETSEPGVGRLVSEALRREWLQRGAYRLIDDPGRAEWVLRGRVVGVETRADVLSPVVLALEYTVTLSLAMELEGGGAAQALPPPLLRESELYLASPDVEALRKNRREALRRVAGLLAERAHDAVDARMVRR